MDAHRHTAHTFCPYQLARRAKASSRAGRHRRYGLRIYERRVCLRTPQLHKVGLLRTLRPRRMRPTIDHTRSSGRHELNGKSSLGDTSHAYPSSSPAARTTRNLGREIAWPEVRHREHGVSSYDGRAHACIGENDLARPCQVIRVVVPQYLETAEHAPVIFTRCERL